MRRCSRCGASKPRAEFAFADMARATRQAYCRVCHAAYRRAHYLANRQKYIDREAARVNRRRDRNRSLVWEYLLAHPCVDCGQADPLVLQFDHRDRAKKNMDVGLLTASRSWTTIRDEVKKCDVRCANCHRLRTARQFNWRKLSPVPLRSPEGASHGRAEPNELLRVCTGCGRSKPVGEFAYRDQGSGSRRRCCKTCMGEYAHAHYLTNRERYATSGWRRDREGRKAMRRYAHEYLVAHPCVDCGETNIVMLDFDHRDGREKVETIAWFLARGRFAELIAEIAKCEIRCANCHQRRTAAQFGWTKLSRAGLRMDAHAGVA